jgi:hypothetical protein
VVQAASTPQRAVAQPQVARPVAELDPGLAATADPTLRMTLLAVAARATPVVAAVHQPLLTVLAAPVVAVDHPSLRRLRRTWPGPLSQM